MTARSPSCAIVGAGMAGLAAAGALQAKGWSVLLLDKGRSFGGRMATRQIGESLFDCGAQFFTMRDLRFREAVGRWERENRVRPWFEEGGHVRYRAVGGMSALARHLATPFDVRMGTRVEFVEPGCQGWILTTDRGENVHADALLMTPPAPQSIALL